MMHFLENLFQVILMLGLSMMIFGFGVCAIAMSVWLAHHVRQEIKEDSDD